MPGNKKPKKKPPVSTQSPLQRIRKLLQMEKGLAKKCRSALQNFEANKADDNDWFSLNYRLLFVVELSQEHYVAETTAQMQESIAACNAIRQRLYTTHATKPNASAEEIELMRAGLDAIEAMEEDTTEAEQLAIYRKVEKMLKS